MQNTLKYLSTILYLLCSIAGAALPEGDEAPFDPGGVRDTTGKPAVVIFFGDAMSMWLCENLIKQAGVINNRFKETGGTTHVYFLTYRGTSREAEKLRRTRSVAANCGVLVDAHPAGDVAKRWQIEGFPDTFVLSGGGKILKHQVGWAGFDPEEPLWLVKAVTPAIESKKMDDLKDTTAIDLDRKAADVRPSPDNGNTPSAESRLKALRSLRDQGLISEDEYQKKRNDILEKF